jgi:hypothetical protein
VNIVPEDLVTPNGVNARTVIYINEKDIQSTYVDYCARTVTGRHSTIVHEVLGRSCTSTGQNPFGQVTEGYLTLSCLLIPCALHFSGFPSDKSLVKASYTSRFDARIFAPEVTYHDRHSRPSTTISFGPDTVLKPAKVPMPDGSMRDTLVRDAAPLFSHEYRPFEATVWLAPLLTWLEGGFRPQCFALVLGRSLQAPESFERIGFADLMGPGFDQKENRAWWGEFEEGYQRAEITIV